MKTKTNTKTPTKKVTKVVLDYKSMFESMKALADNLTNDLQYKSDLAFERFAKIQKLEEQAETNIDKTVMWSVLTFVTGLILGLYI